GGPGRTTPGKIEYSEFLEQVEQRAVESVVIQEGAKGRVIKGRLVDGRDFVSVAPDDPGLIPLLKDNQVKLSAEIEDEEVSPLLSLLISWFPALLIIGVW